VVLGTFSPAVCAYHRAAMQSLVGTKLTATGHRSMAKFEASNSYLRIVRAQVVLDTFKHDDLASSSEGRLDAHLFYRRLFVRRRKQSQPNSLSYFCAEQFPRSDLGTAYRFICYVAGTYFCGYGNKLYCRRRSTSPGSLDVRAASAWLTRTCTGRGGISVTGSSHRLGIVSRNLFRSKNL
jgi:hypothetical protein